MAGLEIFSSRLWPADGEQWKPYFEFVTKSQIFSHSARPNSVYKNFIKWPRRTHVHAGQSLKKRIKSKNVSFIFSSQNKKLTIQWKTRIFLLFYFSFKSFSAKPCECTADGFFKTGWPKAVRPFTRQLSFWFFLGLRTRAVKASPGFSQGILWARRVSQGPEKLSLKTLISFLKLNLTL